MPLVVFSVSGLKAAARAELQDHADRLGLTYQPVLDGKCTHLVSDTVLSDKYAGAVKSQLPVVGPEWIRESARAGRLQPEAPYLLPPCHGLRVVVTGHGFLQVGSAIACPHLSPSLHHHSGLCFAQDVREHIARAVRALGGTLTGQVRQPLGLMDPPPRWKPVRKAV